MAYSACPNCESTRLYKNKKQVSADVSHGVDYLAGLGTFWSPAKFDVVLCSDCGLARYFASREALEKLRTSEKWQAL